MPKQLNMQTLLDVIKALKIDVPIMRIEEDGETGAVTVYLYGGEVKHWPPAATAVFADGIRHDDGIPEAQPRIDPPKPPLEHFTKPPVTRSQLAAEKKKSQRSKKSQT